MRGLHIAAERGIRRNPGATKLGRLRLITPPLSGRRLTGGLMIAIPPPPTGPQEVIGGRALLSSGPYSHAPRGNRFSANPGNGH